MAIEASGHDGTGGRIRLGMVGGGQGAFIGAVHRIAARIDGQFELIAGALSSEPARAKASAAELGIAAERSYGSFEEMARAEAARPDGIEAVSIVTPNHVHAPAARAFLEAGIHVICDKPMTTTVAEAQAVVDLVAKSGKVFVLTHNYTGYPMMRQARAMVAEGELGDIRVVQAEYPQDWLDRARRAFGKQAGRVAHRSKAVWGWRLHRRYRNARLQSRCFRYRTGDRCTSWRSSPPSCLAALLDDDVQILLRYKGGARGMLWASQVAVGNENGLKLRIYGTKGGLEWTQADPNYLWFTRFGQPKQLLTRAGAGALPEAARVSRVPSGHPEGYLEGFATIYAEAARAIRAARTGASPDAGHALSDRT